MVNTKPQYLNKWLVRAEGQTTGLDEIKNMEQDYVRKVRAMEIKKRAFNVNINQEEMEQIFGNLPKLIKRLERKKATGS